MRLALWHFSCKLTTIRRRQARAVQIEHRRLSLLATVTPHDHQQRIRQPRKIFAERHELFPRRRHGFDRQRRRLDQCLGIIRQHEDLARRRDLIGQQIEQLGQLSVIITLVRHVTGQPDDDDDRCPWRDEGRFFSGSRYG